MANWKSRGVDLSALLAPAMKAHDKVDHVNTMKQDHGLDAVLDRALIEKCRPAIDSLKAVTLNEKIINTDRATGTMLSNAIAQKTGNAGLPEGTVKVNFEGTAGQSFGAWLARGVEFNLSGDANDSYNFV